MSDIASASCKDVSYISDRMELSGAIECVYLMTYQEAYGSERSIFGFFREIELRLERNGWVGSACHVLSAFRVRSGRVEHVRTNHQTWTTGRPSQSTHCPVVLSRGAREYGDAIGGLGIGWHGREAMRGAKVEEAQ